MTETEKWRREALQVGDEKGQNGSSPVKRRGRFIRVSGWLELPRIVYGSWPRVLAVAALLIYLAAASYQLDLPGLYQDEALDAVPSMQVLLNQPVDSAGKITLGGREWPLMVMSYVGATGSYWVMLPFAFFGVSVATLRLANLFLGLVALALAWGFLREYLDARVAALSVLLLAVDPSFVFWTKFGLSVSLSLLPLSIGLLWSLYRWVSRRQARYLVLVAFCLGLGLSTKILFIWLAVGLGLGWLILTPGLTDRSAGWRGWLWPLRSAGLGTYAMAVVAFLAGSSMLVLYNLRGLPTLRLILENAGRTQLYGVNNLILLGNLRTVIFNDFRTFLDGRWFELAFGVEHANPLAVPVLLMALAVIAWLVLRGHSRYSPRRVALLLILMAAIVVQSAVTITSLGAPHLIILWPMPQALIAVALFSVTDYFQREQPSRVWLACGIAVAIAVFLVGAQARVTWQYQQTLARTGGEGLYSDAVYSLAHDLEASGADSVVALDWGFRRPVQLLTQGRVDPVEWFTYTQQPGDEFIGRAEQLVSQPAALYLFHSPDHTAFGGHWQLFEQAAYRHRLEPVLWKTYEQRDGEPVYLVYRLEPMPKLANLPATAHPVTAQLGQGISLLGFGIARTTVQPGADLTLTLYWRADARQDKSNKVFVHLVDATRRTLAQYDGVPLYWGYPTTEWQVGELVADPIRLAVSKDAKPGEYRILVGMYDEASGQRLPLTLNGQRVEGDAVQIADVTISR